MPIPLLLRKVVPEANSVCIWAYGELGYSMLLNTN